MKNELLIKRDLSGTTSFPSPVDNGQELNLAVSAFAHLIPYGEEVTIAKFAEMMVEHSSNDKAKALADAIKDTLLMTLIIYKDESRNNMLYKHSFVVSNVDASKAYAEKLIAAQDFNALNVDINNVYTELKTPEGGNFLSGHLS